jgi:hypothetical protein
MKVRNFAKNNKRTDYLILRNILKFVIKTKCQTLKPSIKFEIQSLNINLEKFDQ